ncbi:hypothetical protein H4R34_001058 [Dimargaris verticillata]|uniref:P-loop containing nucleoside triphosphate hydrolase protein n=1 Tax=Dimargaris verticillata TaxID=2761393 RepID=A0A9W8B565_9FUNG|nr:hypothetical protein H4R34_001058 [Dimargaris verticillata]
MALLGELGLVGGTMHLGGSEADNKPSPSKVRTKRSMGPKIGYASQMAWIMAGTVRENILFHAPYDPNWYDKVISGCALERDLSILPHGDQTMVGEKGTNLSGGQRARICLARAIYQRADLYVLDDPLSAVDPHVGRHLFEQAICGLLQNKPRLLVTHQLQFVRECDSVAVLHQGEIVASGPSQSVLTNLPVSKLPGSPASTSNPSVANDSASTLDGFLSYLREVSTHPEKCVPPAIQVTDADSDTASISAHPPAYATNSNRTSVCSSVLSYHSHDLDSLAHDSPIAFPSDLAGAPTHPTVVQGNTLEAEAEAIGGDEEKAMGTTPLSVYYEFFQYGTSPLGLACLLLLLVLTQTSMVFTDVYLSQWASQPRAQQQAWRHSLVYGLLTLLTLVLATVRAVAFFVVVLHGSTRVFQQMLDAVLHSRLHFFQANPQGRILNRFTKDQSSVDELLPMCIFDSFQCTMMVIGAIIIVSIANPWVIIAVPFILMGFGVLRHYYMLTNRVIKRIESTSRSPVYSILSETLDGVGVIRSFRATSHFQQRFVAALNQNSRAFFIFIASSRWLGFRLDMLSFGFLAVASFATVAVRSTADPSMVGLGLSYVLQLLGMVQWLIRQTTEVEIHFVAVERMLAYAHLPKEPNQPTDPEAHPHWPVQGRIEFRGMYLQYPTVPAPVLRNVTLTTQPHEKLGVVGRTGAGKSSLLTALFRLHEAYPAGCIAIDGVDISQLNLHFLRSRISIIPQEAFLFHGTLRFNLDPFDKHTDADIWAALDACKLKAMVHGLPTGLESEVTENGKNFSIGERQLLSLCRAVLRKAPVVVMDEATANVDLNTDQLIQQTIQTEFKYSTVLTIAHRLNTVLGSCHRILVLDQGQVQELGEPWHLLQKPDGWLAGMVARTGPENARKLHTAAHDNWSNKHNGVPQEC